MNILLKMKYMIVNSRLLRTFLRGLHQRFELKGKMIIVLGELRWIFYKKINVF